MNPTNEKEVETSPAEVSAASDDDDDKGAKRSVSNSTAETLSNKRAKKEGDVVPLDLAVTLGYKEGDRIEVHWEIENHETGGVEIHWWGVSFVNS
jgi:hypothetical protein